MRLAAALLALQDKRYEAAEELLDLAIAARPKEAAELLLTWGSALLVDGRPAEAVRVFQRGIDQKAAPAGNPAFYYFLAGALAEADRTDEALAAARKAVAMKKGSPRMANREGWVLFHAKRYAEAARIYQAVVDRYDADHGSDETRQAVREARLTLSNICTFQEQRPEAEEWLQQVLDEYPDDTGALNDLGYLWAERGQRLHRARRMIETAVKDEPDNAAYRDSLGWVHYQLGEYAEAVTELEKAVALDMPDPTIFEHLGDAYLKAGQPEKARETWRRTVELFRKDKQDQPRRRVEEKLHKLQKTN